MSFTVLRKTNFWEETGSLGELCGLKFDKLLFLKHDDHNGYTGLDGGSGQNDCLKYYKVPTMAVSVTLKQLEINEHIHA